MKKIRLPEEAKCLPLGTYTLRTVSGVGDPGEVIYLEDESGVRRFASQGQLSLPPEFQGWLRGQVERALQKIRDTFPALEDSPAQAQFRLYINESLNPEDPFREGALEVFFSNFLSFSRKEAGWMKIRLVYR